ncbi:MAG: hypothetical protein U9R32_07120, partial [Bacteroidota bacterium]|nr:hypothetical protein [Bacteroidota bacterium]
MEGKNIKKRIKKIFYWFLVILMALPILLVGVLNIPQTQVYIAKKITNKISENIDGDISIEKFSINFALKINLKKVLIKDKEHDTLLYAEHIKVRIGNINRTAKVININKAEITGLNFCLRKHKKASTLNINYFIRQLSTKKTSQKWSINVSNAILVNSSFIFDNYNHDKKPASESGMDYNRIGIENINAKISDFYFRNDTIGFWVKKMSATEHSGLVIKDLHSRMKISSTGWKMEDLGIETPLSNIVAIINLSYSEYSDMSDWINKINMSATIKPSQLEMSDIKYFAPLLADMKNQIHITGEISGTISQLNVKNLMLYYKDNTKLYGDINMIGLPNINETFIHLKMKDCETSQKELLGFKLPNNKALILPNKFSKLGYVTINGNFTGFLDNFVSYATFNTDLGELNTDIKLY